ncbi:glycoside hydrolase family 2 TIM barrel-domain containing protein [Hymenobacter sp. GOD-10R]|uniref:glycoside hydrolase family 2 TIM barrel-domain containing protein n=1 Tax=Hymenobacter sp. GOD-10R TaxID=3093922 RepID=UPI002D77C849|nr:glycoside hydrolase family 2 TIM barrel-domain containing protein [Hymenobacter sp. GOD-10R]WRQ30950.1 glycoside hydrolase family 2 TIM barrel-domain containing protein [Hymenobacter sp. GOD-10R]
MKFPLILSLLALSTFGYAQTGPVKVEVKQTDGRYELRRGGQPYFIKGAGGGQFPERIQAYGGNSIRTWGTDNADKVLAEANKNGLTVMLGLDVARERHGFDYNDPQAVATQLQKLRAEVLKYKNDPAVLFWGIGNELNLEYTNPKVWDAVQQIAQMIHEVDPNHPTSTVLAGCNQKEVDYIKARCSAVDILSINTYAGLAAIPQQVRTAGWTGPYVVAEWGPTGHWESPVTPWKASVEETSSQKAAVYQSRYEASVAKDKTQCLGTYVFLWGQKQERTPTWYGIFTEDGKESEVVDVMQYLWSGNWPQNRAPHLASFRLDGKQATDNVYLQPGQRYPVVAAVTDPNQDPITYRWELLPESTDLKTGGDRESRPAPIPGLIPASAKGQTTLTAPAKEGAYRLFIYAYDGHDNVATANIPFYVQRK